MRLILVRHGESASNRRGEAQAFRVRRGEETEAEASASARSDELATEPTGDTFLTENGEEQVECFGRYWAPILERVAAKGKLRIFCSPMRRNL